MLYVMLIQKQLCIFGHPLKHQQPLMSDYLVEV